MIKWFEQHKWASLIVTILLAGEIFWFSSIPGTSLGKGLPLQIIAYHFIIFFLFNFFILLTITRNNLRTNKFITAGIISSSYAILDEIHQIHVPMRSASVLDFGIDFLGIVFASLIFIWIKRKSKIE